MRRHITHVFRVSSVQAAWLPAVQPAEVEAAAERVGGPWLQEPAVQAAAAEQLLALVRRSIPHHARTRLKRL